MNIFEKLNKLSRKKESKRKNPSYIYLDEKDNQIKEIPLNLDSAGALINKAGKKKQNPKLIHDSIFGKT